MLTLLLLLATSAAPPGDWPSGFRAREEIEVLTFDAGVGANYAVSITFDHAALIDGGLSMPGGDDVHLMHWGGPSGWTELPRVLDTGSAWASSATQLWFDVGAPLPAGTTDDNYYLLTGSTTPFAASQHDPRRVFLFADDFEDGTLAAWDVATARLTASLGVDGTRAHSGSKALHSQPQATGIQELQDGVVLPDDVFVEQWWYLAAEPPSDVALVFRQDSALDNNYDFGDYAGWCLATRASGAATAVNARVTVVVARQWTRVAAGIVGTRASAFLNGTPLFSNVNMGTQFPTGRVGIGRLIHPSDPNPDGGSDWWIDDVRARPLVAPEPITSVSLLVETPPPPDGGAGLDAGGTDGGANGMPDGGANGTPDGGSAPDGGSSGPGAYQVGCGCGVPIESLPVGALLLGLLIVAQSARRRS